MKGVLGEARRCRLGGQGHHGKINSSQAGRQPSLPPDTDSIQTVKSGSPACPLTLAYWYPQPQPHPHSIMYTQPRSQCHSLHHTHSYDHTVTHSITHSHSHGNTVTHSPHPQAGQPAYLAHHHVMLLPIQPPATAAHSPLSLGQGATAAAAPPAPGPSPTRFSCSTGREQHGHPPPYPAAVGGGACSSAGQHATSCHLSTRHPHSLAPTRPTAADHSS